MKVLMFGWEFPPKIYGGLAVASYGITKGLSVQGDVQTTFCLPRPTGEEEKFLNIINMSQVPVVWREPEYENLCNRLVGHTSGDYYRFRNHIYADFNYLQGLDDLGCIGFAGGYPSNLHEEINNFSIISGVLARSEDFDLIHAHDWLTYPAGVHAKMVSGKPLCIHVHATDFDRSRGKVNPTVYSIEKNGMDHADCIMCVSELTRQTVIHQYHQDPRKCVAMHNAVYPLSEDIRAIEPHKNPDEKVVTFLGRITMQKGPEYFIEAAKRVLDRSRNIRFCFAGSGDMLNAILPQAGICAVVFALDRLGIYKKRRTVLTVSVFLLCFICGTVVMFSENPSVNRLVLTACSSLLCASSVTFYSGTVNCIKKKRSPYMLDNRSLVCIVASLCTILLGSSEISLLGFRPARFFGCFVILAASYIFSRSGGSIAGIAIGGCIAVSGTSVALSICYGICGLLSGVFSRFGQLVCALVFSVTAGIAALIDGSAEGIAVFAEAATASIVFALIPSSYLAKMRGNILNPGVKRISSEFGAAGNRLLEASRAIGSVSDCVAKVSEGIESLSPASDELVCMRVRERVCSACPLKNTFCPEEGEFSEILKKLAEGETVINNAAREPEICDMCRFLRSCGAKIRGDGESSIVVEGVETLHGCEYRVMPDRIAGATYLAMTAAAGGEIILKNACISESEPFISVLEQTGCCICCKDGRIYLRRGGRLKAIRDRIRTMPHPGFPTDAQAVLMAALATADGTSVFEENIFDCRYRHTDALIKMGADIQVMGKAAVIRGVRRLHGADADATDLRGGAAMVVAALSADGESRIGSIFHIDRGYEKFENIITSLGGSIRRE